MFYRHVLAYLVLLAAYPHRHPSGGFREELLFAGAGIFGSTLYFLTENYALKYSMASNVGLLLATTPMLTAIVARFLTTGEPFNRQLAAGFCIAFLGCFPRHLQRALYPKASSDRRFPCHCRSALLGVLLHPRQKNSAIATTGSTSPAKSSFTLSSPCSPVLAFGDFRYDFSRLWQPSTYLNLIFLGVIASSLCFLIWSKIIWKIGPVAVNNFIYLMPLITMLASWLLLDEHLTPIAIAGGLVILAGVYVSTKAAHRKK